MKEQLYLVLCLCSQALRSKAKTMHFEKTIRPLFLTQNFPCYYSELTKDIDFLSGFTGAYWPLVLGWFH